jgi:hypothetical protein
MSSNALLIVIGDFNTGDREPRYGQLAARMHDAFRETNSACRMQQDRCRSLFPDSRSTAWNR